VSKYKADAGLTFKAVIDRDELIGRRLRHMAEQLCGGSLTPLLINLVKLCPLSERALQHLPHRENSKMTGHNIQRAAARECREQIHVAEQPGDAGTARQGSTG
jgi:hypothetical protein